MSQNGSITTTFDGHLEDEDILKDTGRASPIRIAPVEGGGVFHINRMTIHLLQMNRLFGGQSHEDANLHLKDSLMCVFYWISRKYIKNQSACDFFESH